MPGQLRYYIQKTKRAVIGAMIHDTWRKKVFYLKEEYPNEFIYEDGFLKLLKFDCRIKQGDFFFILERYDVLSILQSSLHAQISIQDDRLIISFNNLVFNPTTAEELFIMEEVYVNGTYNFQNNHPVVVIDVGMNVGFA